MHYVYVMKSLRDNLRTYVGYSIGLKARIKSHNYGQTIYTAKYKPWKLIYYSAFSDMDKAKLFEKYLKTDSGKAFMRKRLISE